MVMREKKNARSHETPGELRLELTKYCNTHRIVDSKLLYVLDMSVYTQICGPSYNDLKW